MRKIVAAVFFVILTQPSALAQSFEAGKQYTILAKPIETASRSKIEVTVFFAYTCVHCAALSPTEKAWTQAQPSDVVVRRLPVAWNDMLKVFSEAYYVAVENDIEPELNSLLIAYQFSLPPAPEGFGKTRRLVQGYRVLGNYFSDLDRMQSDFAYCQRVTRDFGKDAEMDAWLERRVCRASDQGWQLMRIAREYRNTRGVSKAWMSEFFALLGVHDFNQDRDEWMQEKLKVDTDIMRRAGITATPTVMVNGKYVVKPSREAGVDRGNIFDVVDYLVEIERGAGQPAD